jgi:hypothetical protein
MIRLHITSEGMTEQNFAKKILTPHLAGYNIFVDARSVRTKTDKRAAKEYRGGLLNYEKAKKDLAAWMKEDHHGECRFTTMFDLYALPNDFPGYAESYDQRDPYERIKILEERMAADINDRRFVPYIQLHEFETLILADPQRLSWKYLEHDTPIHNLISMVGCQNPELINDGQETAPSKRILKEIPEYDKATAGPIVAERIGLPALRARCAHFHEWLSRLEQLAGAPGSQL